MIKYKIYCILYLLVMVTFLPSYAAPPIKSKFEQDRKNLLQKIKTINQILAQTQSKKHNNIGQLTAFNKKIEANDLLIASLSKEVGYINQDLKLQVKKSENLQMELIQLKKEYANILFVGTKSMRDINILVFIFSADSFQTLLQRLRATKQYTKLRKTHFEEIIKTDNKLRYHRVELERQTNRKKWLIRSRKEEQQKLYNLKQKQHQIITHLEQQHNKLMKELKQQNDAVKNLDKLISDIINKDIISKESIQIDSPKTNDSKKDLLEKKAIPIEKKSIIPAKKQTSKLLPLIPGKTLGIQFAKNQGQLSWPVKNGFISNKFGIRTHAVLTNVQVENLGIDIQTQQNATVHAIFIGIVKTISFVPGMNHVVIIQHGEYHTVYARLSSTTVRVGQRVQMQDMIGKLYTDKNGTSELQLQIWKGGQKLNPAIWLTKQPT